MKIGHYSFLRIFQSIITFKVLKLALNKNMTMNKASRNCTLINLFVSLIELKNIHENASVIRTQI